VKTTKLYRAVSYAEFHDLIERGMFRQGPNSLFGKWFAENANDAAKWGEALQGAGNFRIIEVNILIEQQRELFRIDRLDNIGPAWYVELDQLIGATFREIEYES
jgi:hypothetical protein